jgi:hypothetical protein
MKREVFNKYFKHHAFLIMCLPLTPPVFVLSRKNTKRAGGVFVSKNGQIRRLKMDTSTFVSQGVEK